MIISIFRQDRKYKWVMKVKFRQAGDGSDLYINRHSGRLVLTFTYRQAVVDLHTSVFRFLLLPNLLYRYKLQVFRQAAGFETLLGFIHMLNEYLFMRRLCLTSFA